MRSCACCKESRSCSRSEYAVSSIGSRTMPFCSRVDIWLCTSATLFWNLRNISLVSIGWMKMEMSMTLSMLMMGANHPVVRKRGYEMTKNVRATFSPRSSSRELIFRACGAMTSCRSRTPVWYISSGSTGSTRATGVFFFPKGSRSVKFMAGLQFTVYSSHSEELSGRAFCIVLLTVNCSLLTVQGHRLPLLAGVEQLVEKLNRFLRPQLHGAHAGANEALLDDADALFELADLLLKRPVCLLGIFFRAVPGEHGRGPAGRDRARGGRIRHDDEEILRHDVGRFREALDELDVLADLDAHQVVELFLVRRFEGGDVGADVEHARLHEYLHREVK